MKHRAGDYLRIPPRMIAAPLTRLARAHEVDADLQQDLLQEIHIATWTPNSMTSGPGRKSTR